MTGEMLTLKADGKVVPAAPSKKVTFECFKTPKELDPVQYFTASEDAPCPIKGTVANGKFAVGGACGEGDAREKMVSSGEYSQTAFKGSMTVEFVSGGANLVAEAAMSARHMGACTGKEDKVR
jgi:hypothetical protein